MSKLFAWLGVAMLAVICAPRIADAGDPLKPYVVFVMDTSGSMDSSTGAGPTSCGYPDTRRDHAKCAINKIVNSYGDMVFALGRFRMTMGGTFPSCTLDGPDSGGVSCDGTDDMFELLTPLVDGNNELAARWTDGTMNTCTATGTDPEIWQTDGNTPIAGSLVGVKDYWLGNQTTNFTLWPAAAGLAGGFDPIEADPTNTAFLARPGTGTSVCNSDQASCSNAVGCTGADCCCLEQCRPYIVIMLTDGDETCVAFNPNATNAAASLLASDTLIGGVTRRYRIETKAIAFGKAAPDPEIEALAHAGGTPDDSNPATLEGFYAQNEAELQLAISSILADAIKTESCNNLDDDCDTLIDEDFAGKAAQCNNGKLGKCRVNGANVCRIDGTGLSCDAGQTACNGLSAGNACSVTNVASAIVAGTCQASPAGLICQPTAATGADPNDPTDNEIPFGCNQIDDDCDGAIDEGLQNCGCVPLGEVCDNMDNDCDGIVDDNLTRPCGTGVCLGTETCSAGVWGGCTAQPATAEVCDGLDNNCDGNADGFNEACSNLSNGFPAFDPLNNPGADHTPNTGCETLGALCICHPGTRTCPLNGGGTFGACTGEVTPQLEICNGLDDDCDGMIDETPPVTCTNDTQCANTPLTPSCDNPTNMANMGTCVPADCSSNCGVGQLICTNGMQMCNAVPAPNDDTCDGVDDDCDNMVDEDWVCADPDGPDNVAGNADDCACTASGQCGATESCQNGSTICMGDPVGQESCNCDDDDCDGNIDEGSLCGAGAQCVACQCAFQCSPGEFPCPAGKKCEMTGNGNFCVADPCFGVTCPNVNGNKQVCQPVNNAPTCVSACDPAVITCNSPLICFGPTGECKPNDCTTFPDMCAANQNCINGTCVTNPCQGVTCPTGQNCVSGQCYGSCVDVECPAGQRCRLGSCVADPCGMSCPFGQVCHDETGECVANPCEFVQCPIGQYCNPNNNGICEDDPCVLFGIQCAAGEVCQGGTCFDENDFKPDAGVETHVTTGGGGGCSTGGGGASFVFALGLAVMLLRRRREGGAS